MNISNHSQDLRNYLVFRNYSKNSINNYCCCFEKFLSFFEAKNITHPSKITQEMVIVFLSKFKEPSTHTAYHSAIKLYYEKVARVGIDKFKYIERPKQNKKLPIILSVNEIQKMFNVCENTKHKLILSLLYSCGLRVSELINLRWKDIDRERMVINIIQAKNNKDRQVMLAASIIPLLTKYYYEYRSKEYVLNGQFSLQYSETSVNNVVKQLAAKSNIKKRVYTHLIRHCCFSHMLESGTNLHLIQKLAGHSSPKTTEIYCKITSNLISKINSPIQSITI